ncbi:MAG: HEAT repeat domain-containing protein [Promethearchaeia archaeon]
MLSKRAYFPQDLNMFNNSTSIILFIIFLAAFVFGFFLIYRQVALVKKGEFEVADTLQCVLYGFIFSMAIMIVIGMAFIFAVNTPSFWEPTPLNPNPPSPPNINPLWLILPVLVCLIYISVYPLIDFLFIALSEESDEGLTVFHKFLGDHIINRTDNKTTSIISAVGFYLGIFILPPLIFYFLLGFPFITIYITWMIAYPLMILTFYGSKGWVAGFYNVLVHIEQRSFFLGFEDTDRMMEEAKDFPNITGPRILLGMMLFVFVWAWISMIQTLAFYFSGQMAISTYSYAGMVFVTLLFGIIGYFTRYWNRQIKYRGIDISFAGYLMAAVGINVLANFLIVNSSKLYSSFNYTIIGMHELIPNFLLFSFAAVIEEVVLITFTSYFILSRTEFTENLKISKINECAQTFDPIPLFNFLRSDDPKIRNLAEENILLMFERIPLKDEINLNKGIFKNTLIDGLCDPNPHSQRVCYKILLQLEKDVPEVVLPWIIENLESPNYDKSIPFARSLLTADKQIIEQIPEDIIFNLIQDLEWRLKVIALDILSRFASTNSDIILTLLMKKRLLNKLVNDPDGTVQVKILNILADAEVLLPLTSIIERLNHSNPQIRAAAIRNIKNIKEENIDSKIVSKLIPHMRDPSSEVRASLFKTLAKIGNFQKYFIPIFPFLEGLTDLNKDVRKASIIALERYFDEQPESVDLDMIINRIDPNNQEIVNSVLTLLGRLWDKNPEKILTTLLIFIKFENQSLKENISNILIDKYQSNPDLVIKNLIKIPDVTKFITKGIITRTLIKIGDLDPQKVIPRLISYLSSEYDEIKLNAITALEDLVNRYPEEIQLKPFLRILTQDEDIKIRKEASKVISNVAQTKPDTLKPVVSVFLQAMHEQESSVKLVLGKSLLKISEKSPQILPVRPIINLFNDDDSFIRETSAKILGNIGYKAPREAVNCLLEKGVKDNEWNVREASVTSLGNLIEYVEDKDMLISNLTELITDDQSWVRRSALNILADIKNLTPDDLPLNKLKTIIHTSDDKVKAAGAKLLNLYDQKIDEVFNLAVELLEHDNESVRNSMINSIIKIIQNVGLKTVISRLLKNLSDEGSITLQRSIAKILGRTAKYEEEKIKKRVISLLKIRCEMSQDPLICKVLNELRES